jgi:hypothetical protein
MFRHGGNWDVDQRRLASPPAGQDRRQALANPEALALYRDLAELRG